MLGFRARNEPDAPFLIFNEGERTDRYTYAETWDLASRGAAFLERLSVATGDRVLVTLPNSVEFFAVWFGAAMLGAVIVPVSPQSTDDDYRYFLAHAQCRAAVACAATEEVLSRAASEAGIPVLRDVEIARQPSHHIDVNTDVSPRDPLAIMYTSGTTSRPKGVIVTHANYLVAGEAVAESLRMRPDDRWLVVLPLHHANAQYYCAMSALVTGASIAVTPRFSASAWSRQASRHGATLASLFAAPLRMILAQTPHPHDGLNRLRATLFAQNLTSNELQEFEERFGCPLLQVYGMTETIAPPLMNRLYGRRDNATIGVPIPGARVRVVTESDTDAAIGEPGELLVWGEPGRSLMLGYLHDAAATAAAVQDGWLRTGDVVQVRKDGMFVFEDRQKDMIKRAGENVAAAEVERVVNMHPAVFQSAAIGVPDPIRDEQIVVFAVLKDGMVAEPEAIVAYCAQKLPTFKVPSTVLLKASLPATAVGKTQKHVLRAEYAQAVRPGP